MVTDGQRIVACRYGTAGDGDSDAELGATLYLSRLERQFNAIHINSS